MDIGDIYAFYDERMGCWNACQITGFKQKAEKETGKPLPPHTAVLLLDWAENRPPDAMDFPTLKPFVKTFYSWKNELEHSYVSDGKPDRFILCGNRAPILSGDGLRSYGGWPGSYAIFRQKLWDAMPEPLRIAYKTAERGTNVLNEADIPTLLPDYRGFSDFAKLPGLRELRFSTWTEGLAAHLRGNPIIYKLFLNGRQPEVLDFRGTGLTEITLHADGVKEIHLNDITDTLRLRSVLDPGLVVHDPHTGKYITLTLGENQKIPQGLDRLRGVWIDDITNADLARTLDDHREIIALRLWGKPGNITSLRVVGELKKLNFLTMKDIFGFTGADFPPPEELPALSALWMTSLPHEAAQAVKKKYRARAKSMAFDLDIRQGRKTEWLAANMDNPFRDWDGDDRIPPGCAKKAADIYRKTRLEMQKAVAAEAPQEECTRLCAAYVETFNKMDEKHEFIDTVLREDIIMALDKIITAVAASSGAEIDAEKLMETCEKLRDF